MASKTVSEIRGEALAAFVKTFKTTGLGPGDSQDAKAADALIDAAIYLVMQHSEERDGRIWWQCFFRRAVDRLLNENDLWT